MKKFGILLTGLVVFLTLGGFCGNVHATLLGDSVDGILNVHNINDGTLISNLGETNVFKWNIGGPVTDGSGTPQTVGAGTEFYIHQLNAGAYGSIALDQFLDIDVDLGANSMSVMIGGNFLSNPGGIIPAFDILISAIDATITNVTETSADFAAGFGFTAHSININSDQFSTAFGGPSSFTNIYDITFDSGPGPVIPEPSTLLLLGTGLLGLLGYSRHRRSA